MKILTSLAPKNLEIQNQAINSWKELGVPLISFNHTTEIDKVSPHFEGISFIECENSARELHGGKIPYPCIMDMLKYIFKQEERCCIINSDIILAGDPFFEAASLGKPLVFGHRVDIDSSSLLEGQFYTGGYDYFILGGEVEHLFLNMRPRFCIGQPWWDFWLPTTMIRKGIRPTKFCKPLGFHVKHEIQWDIDQLFYYGNLLSKEIGYKEFSRSELGAFTEIVSKTIEDNSDEQT